jgi:predicted nuclease of predicted toxin-antitoxin system
MKFLLDESADYPLAAFLQGLGHDVTAIAHEYPQALTDRAVLSIAQSELRILITNDHDFGELIFRQRLPHHGVILFRLGAETLLVKTRWLEDVLSKHANDLGDFVVITDHGIRVRRTTRG